MVSVLKVTPAIHVGYFGRVVVFDEQSFLNIFGSMYVVFRAFFGRPGTARGPWGPKQISFTAPGPGAGFYGQVLLA